MKNRPPCPSCYSRDATTKTWPFSCSTDAKDYVPKEDLTQRTLVRAVRYALERKRSEEQVKSTERRFRLLVEGAPVAMMMAGDDGRILLVNPQIEKLFGYDRAELIGHPVDILIPERFRFLHRCCLDAFSRAREAQGHG